MMLFPLAEATVIQSLWPSDTVSLAILGLLTMIVKEWLDRSRQAKADTKVESVAQTLAVQEAQACRREDKLDAVADKVDHNTRVTVLTAETVAAAAVASEETKAELVEAVVTAVSDKGAA